MRGFTIRIVGIYCLLSLIFSNTFGQSAGDYRTISSGPWTTAGIWQRFDGSAWQAAGAFPTSSDGVILIQDLHNVTIQTAELISADQIILSGTLTVDSGGTLNLVNGSGTDLILVSFGATVTVDGTLIRQNLSEISNPFSSANIQFNAGSLYSHRYTTTFGDLPAATWNLTSTVSFTSFSNTTPITANSTWNQSFGNITYHCSNQRELVDFAGNLTTVLGNLSISRSGNNAVQLGGSQDFTFNLGADGNGAGNLNISGNARLFMNVSGNVTANIFGSINQSSSNSGGSYLTFTGTTTVNLYGDLVINGNSNCKIRMAGAGSTGRGIFNLYGNFNLVSGRLDEAGSGSSQGNINFLRNGNQDFFNGGVLAGFLTYFVSENTILDLGTSPVSGSSASRFEVEGTVILGSTEPLGAISSGPTANIRISNQIYHPGAVVVYGGSAPQFLSEDHPTNASLITVIDNPQGVTLVTDEAMAGELRLQSGTFRLNNFILRLFGTLSSQGGNFGGTANSRLYVQGTGDGDFGDIVFNPGENTLNYLYLNRTGTNVNVNVASDLVITANLTMANGTLTNLGGLELANGALVTRYENGLLAGTPFTVSPGGRYNLYYRTFSPSGGPYAVISPAMELLADPDLLGDFAFIGAQNADQLVLNQDIVVNGVFSLSGGQLVPGAFDITMNGPNWNDNTNGFLVPGSGAVIFNGTTTVSGSANPLFGNVQTTPSANVTFARSFNIEGNIAFDPASTLNFNNVTMTLSGSTPQSVSANGASIPNITVAKGNGQGVTLTSGLNLTGILQFSNPSNNVNVQSNGFLQLISTSDGAGSGTAQIYRLNNGNQISGNVTVNRYMSGEDRIYRYISSPVSNSNVAQLQDDFIVGGNFVDPSPGAKICGYKISSADASLFFYDETVPGDINDGYVAYPFPGATAAGSPLAVGRGYTTFIRECVNPTIIDYTGSINHGPLTLPVTYTVSDPGGDGWNLVGNPYPSTIDWDAGWTKTRISPSIAIMDNAIGMFRYYEAGVADDIPGGRIALGQAFWVRATGPSPVLRITENAKVTLVGEFFRESAPEVPKSFMITLSKDGLQDYAYVRLHDDASPGRDELDVPKIKNPEFGLSTVVDGRYAMAINAVSELSCGASIPLRTEGLKPGTYSLSLDSRGHFADFDFYLEDKFEGTRYQIDGATVEFTVAQENTSDDRFEITIEQKNNFKQVQVAGVSACTKLGEVALTGVENGVRYGIWGQDGNLVTEPSEATSSKMVISFKSDSIQDGRGLYIVKAIPSCGEPTDVSASFEIRTGTPSLTDVSSQYNCSGGSFTLSAVSDDVMATINWYSSKDASSPIHTGNIFQTPELTGSETYYVEATTSLGCSSGRTAVNTELLTIKDPEIIAEGMTLTSNYVSGNEWYFNDVPLAGANGQSVTMTQVGKYTLYVNVNGCRMDRSYLNESSGIQIYPNPVVDNLNIREVGDDVQDISLFTVQGLKIKSIYQKGQNFTGEVDLESVPDGVYLLIVTRATEKQSHRIIKGRK